MAYKITDECIACGTCLETCPYHAIEEGDIFKITMACENCGTCMDICPAGAIIEE
ncbi:4Fe-4S binding protein [Desulforamulus hydrothermalis]|uniref:Ferredoxin n=1 Tax=Desulforamulus hydrothermalis Lam5 = DSM 18033 TaxID=1121428 RepID=K8ELU2_9FIRM|nr:4Fe-4S binding protein [Desulforamulus hydrothermalis]CCO09441.1 Ferredoxin [Desulforamulus hydrothermalis Lam5 = DSM 18033]SHH08085.1 4Fe-4S binding domain-containing protein [Desulforamulus hydrothermalis Lam5 = DSM 18033]